MKILKICLCLLAAGTCVSTSRGQDAAAQKETGTLGATEKPTQKPADQASTADKEKEAVPEEFVPEKQAIKQLVGDYRIVSGENSGKEVLPERLEDVTVRFTEKTITTYDGERNARFNATYRLDTQKRPWRIKMTSTDKPAGAAPPQNGARPATTTSEGLIEIDDGRVKVIYALPGGLAPESFQTGERQQRFVLERLAEPTEKAKTAGHAPPADKTKSTDKAESKEH